MVEWFYGKGGQQYGPIDEATLRARISTGEVGPADLIWSEGMTSWTPLSQLSQFSGGGASPPKLPDEDPILDGDSSSPYAPPRANLGGGHPAGPALPVTNGLAIASMVCGILSLAFFCFCGAVFFGLPAVICGHMALNQLNHSESLQQGRGMAIAGLICGYAGIAIFAVVGFAGNFNIQF